MTSRCASRPVGRGHQVPATGVRSARVFAGFLWCSQLVWGLQSAFRHGPHSLSERAAS
jgi:hypothetical protein